MSAPRNRPPSHLNITTELDAFEVKEPRYGFVQYQLGLARLSLSLQVPRAARAALLVLSRDDFPADPVKALAYLTALHDPALSTAGITAAVEALGEIASLSEESVASVKTSAG